MIKIYRVEKSIYYGKENKLYNLMLYTETEHGFGSGKIFEGSYNECQEEKRRILKEDGKVKRLRK